MRCSILSEHVTVMVKGHSYMIGFRISLRLVELASGQVYAGHESKAMEFMSILATSSPALLACLLPGCHELSGFAST